MSKIPSVKPKKLLQILKKKGFYIHHQKGSHLVLKSINNENLRVTLPYHTKDLKIKTLLSILREANLDKDILLKGKK